jgi:hypothetical protein
MPHVHAIVDSHDFGEEHVERLRLHLSNWRNQYGEPLDLVPDIDVRPISTPRSLLDRTRYLYKPINLARPYDTAWHNQIANDRSRVWELNSQARELAAGVFEARKNRTRMFSKGTLNPRAKGFIGVAKEVTRLVVAFEDETPFHPGWKTCATPATESRFFYLFGNLIWLHFLERFFNTFAKDY